MILSDFDNIAYNKFADGEITLAEYIKYQNRDKIMNYEEKYKQALEKAREIHRNEDEKRFDMEWIFPELKESEDERTRRAIIQFFNLQDDNTTYSLVPKKDILAWLEKQGEFKSSKWTEGDVVRHGGVLALVTNGRKAMKSNCEQITIQYPDEWVKAETKERKYFFEQLEKQGEQPTDKVEPTFKVGDWIVNTHNRLIWQITCIRNSLYYLRDVNGNEGYETYDGLQDNYRLWSISDARDGDILACNKEILLFKSASALGYISLHCWYNGQTNRFHSKAVYDTLMTTRNKICPATKEQQDLFIQKMKEAGYEWDAEKKELKKIEPKKLDADKVIEWLERNSSMFWDSPCNPSRIVELFKKDFEI